MLHKHQYTWHFSKWPSFLIFIQTVTKQMLIRWHLPGKTPDDSAAGRRNRTFGLTWSFRQWNWQIRSFWNLHLFKAQAHTRLRAHTHTPTYCPWLIPFLPKIFFLCQKVKLLWIHISLAEKDAIQNWLLKTSISDSQYA